MYSSFKAVWKTLISGLSLTLMITMLIAPPATAAGPGVTASTPSPLSSASEGHLTEIAASSDGNSAVAIWTNGGQDTVYASYWNGTEWKPTQTVYSGTTMVDFEVAASPNGKSFAVAYRRYSAGVSYVHTSTVSSGDLVWSTGTSVFGTSNYSFSAELTYSADSNKLMAYAGQIQSGNTWQDIVTTSAAIDAITGEATWDASAMFIPNPVVGNAEDVEGSPVISLSSDGKAGVAISSRDVYGVVSKRTIQISFYSCTGAPEVCTWSDTADLTSTSDYALSPNVVMSNDGQSVFAYWKNNSGSIVSKSATYAASMWTWDASTATLPTVGDEQYLDFAHNADRTKFVLAWSSSNEIYSTTSLNSGSTWSSAQSHGFAAAGATTEPSVDISDGVSPVIVVMYGISGKAKAMAGRVTGSTIEWGSATEFGSTSGFRSSVAVKGDGSAALSAWGQSPSYTSTLTFEPPSSDSALTALSFSSGALSPVFASGTTSYTSTVAYSVNSVTISATKSNAGATIEYRLGSSGAFTALISGTSSVSLAVGANTVEVKVTAEDTTTTTYSTVITRSTAATNANLSSLSFSSGALSPVFASGTTSYTSTVPYTASSVTITGTKSDANATIEYRLGTAGAFTALVSGTSSVSLAVGANTVEVKVTAEDGSTTNTYSIVITRETLSSNADLSALSFSSVTLSPTFAGGTTSYTSTVAYSVNSVTISATKSNGGATIEYRLGTAGAFTTLNSGTSSVSLAVGANTVEVKVTAEDGSTTKTYSVVITRSVESSDSTLSSLSFSSGTLSPSFSSGTYAYTSTISYGVNSVTISATKSNGGATIEYRLGTSGAFTALNSGTSSVSLAVGANTVEVKVTAEDGSSSIYSFTLTVDSDQSNDPVVEVEVDENGNVTIVVTDPNNESTTSTVTGASKPVEVSIVNGQLVVEDETFSGNVEVTIQVENQSGFSTTVTVLLVVNPELPSGLKIKLKTLKKKPNQVTGSDVQLSWRSVSNATSYQILVGSNVVGSTTSTSYQLRNILFNKSISVIALGNDETSSQAVTIDAKPSRGKIANVNFDFNAWELSKSAKSALKNVAKLVRKSDIDTVVIQGNTDIIGSKWSARWLSKIRAETVKKFLQMRLKGLGIKFKIVASGSSNPVKSNSSATGRALNRRVEILFP